MSNRLLTDDEIRESGLGLPACTRSKHRTAERAASHLDAARRACICQDVKTLKEVGEWLRGNCQSHHPGWYRCDCPGCVRNLAYALLGGKMPE